MRPGFRVRNRIRTLSILLFALGIFCPARKVGAQDPFELRVEEYEEAAFGAFTFEEHFIDFADGTLSSDGTVAPTNHQFHMSSEFTAGIAPEISVGAMLLTGVVPGQGGLQYAGWRVLPHLYLPDSWRLPAKFGLTAEFSFQRTIFDESPRTVELRPVIEKRIRNIQFDLNPSVERSLLRSETGWIFEPSFRLAYDRNPRFNLGLEYFSSMGLLSKLLPFGRQVNQLFPDARWKLKKSVLWDVGVGAGLTQSGNHLVLKSRIEYSFGRTR